MKCLIAVCSRKDSKCRVRTVAREANHLHETAQVAGKQRRERKQNILLNLNSACTYSTTRNCLLACIFVPVAIERLAANCRRNSNTFSSTTKVGSD